MISNEASCMNRAGLISMTSDGLASSEVIEVRTAGDRRFAL
jgi:hypothetical protein